MKNTNHSPIVVVLSTRYLGNLILMTEAAKAIARQYGPDRVHFVADLAFRELLEDGVGLSNLIYYPRAEYESRSTLGRIAILWKLACQLARLRAQKCICLDEAKTSVVMSFFTRAAERIGDPLSRLQWLHTQTVASPARTHRFETYNQIALAGGVEVAARSPRFSISAAVQARMMRKLHAAGIDEARPLVVIHPGARNAYKQWYSSGFAQLIDALHDEGRQVAIVGGPGDQAKVADILRRSTYRPFDLSASRLGLAELAALFQHSAVVIGNDSGPIHLAGAAGTQTLSIFGPTDEQVWRPLSPRATIVRAAPPREGASFSIAADELAAPDFRGVRVPAVLDALAEMLPPASRAEPTSVSAPPAAAAAPR